MYKLVILGTLLFASILFAANIFEQYNVDIGKDISEFKTENPAARYLSKSNTYYLFTKQTFCDIKIEYLAVKLNGNKISQVTISFADTYENYANARKYIIETIGEPYYDRAGCAFFNDGAYEVVLLANSKTNTIFVSKEVKKGK